MKHTQGRFTHMSIVWTVWGKLLGGENNAYELLDNPTDGAAVDGRPRRVGGGTVPSDRMVLSGSPTLVLLGNQITEGDNRYLGILGPGASYSYQTALPARWNLVVMIFGTS